MQFYHSLKDKDYFIDHRDFTRSEVIVGEGSYGVVYKGMYGRIPCALKYIRSYLFQTASASNFSISRFEQECQFVRQVTNQHIVKFIGVSYDDRVPVLITELMECSLTEVLGCQYCSLPYHREVNIALGIARGLDYLHSQQPPIVHRDLSSNNVLLAADYTVKIADLGVAKYVDASSSTPVPGTAVYMPPEVFKRTQLSIAIDLFSYAVLLVQLETRQFPSPTDKEERVEDDEDGVGRERDGGGTEGGGECGGGMEGEKRDGGETEVGGVGRSECNSEGSSGEKGGFKTRTEWERRESHIHLMEKTGVFYRIVMCYLEENPRIRRRTEVKEVMAWLDEATHVERYTESILGNPETPLEHRTSNHLTRRGQPLLSVPSKSSHRSQWWRRGGGKRSGGVDDNGYHSQQRRHTAQLGLDRSSDGWLLVEGQSPSDSSGRRFLRGVVYSLSRLSTALGLTGGDEDDSQYKQRVMRSL